MIRLVVVTSVICLLLLEGFFLPAYGWNNPTHMVTGAISYRELQTTAPKPPRQWNTGYFGLYGSLNRTQTNPTISETNLSGWQAGVYGRTGGTLFWQLGVEYRNITTPYRSLPNSLSTSIPPAGPDYDEIKQNLLVFPTYLGLRFGKKVGIHLQVGAEVTTLISADYPPNSLGGTSLRRSTYNGLGGGGIHVGPVTLDVIYHQGLQTIYTDGSATKGQQLSVSLGCRL
ncbi:hypothetical protein G8759_14700 [Spirosoma aureum]|uniref:PorT family protein n=1 Tax=Spirosoma aureum TaxID=2692134 RepID=A0A6G9ANI6_9BACT|nr:hypothetical protein [Spirosoma aureum]QIP13773.1 hypothetical protein G8759_14700 [Spirosoma aureum]